MAATPISQRPTTSNSSVNKTSDDEDAVVEVDDADHDVDDTSESKPKKKRRVIKITDKKYECPQPDCGKSYSRAEHLYRHQLNRA